LLARKNTSEEQKYARSGNVPCHRTDEKDPERIQRKVGDSPGDMQECAPLGKLPVGAGEVNDNNKRQKQGKRFNEVGKCALEPAGGAGEWYDRFVSGAGRPPVATLQTGRVRGQDDVNQSKDDAQADDE